MPRCKQFHSPVYGQIINQAKATPWPGTVSGPLTFLNPTRATFPVPLGPGVTDVTNPPDDHVHVAWRARDNRKGRHALVVPASHSHQDSPQLSTSSSALLEGIRRMFTVFAWWDVSWWIAVLFSVGSADFVICGIFYWLPIAAPSTAFPGESLTGGGITAFIGATLFEIGAVLLIIEAVNENQTECFGWALGQALSHDEADMDSEGLSHRFPIQTRTCTHHHSQKDLRRRNGARLLHPASGRKWEWWPTWHEFRTHYFWEIGFLGSFVESAGATIFYVTGIMALPGIINRIPTPVLNGTYWLAYLLGGILFITSSFLYILETQKYWWQPAPTVLGWWIGAWNLVGSIGFMLSAVFGYCTPGWCIYQSDLSLLWGSCAFLIGSLLLWYEALDKYPVKRAKT